MNPRASVVIPTHNRPETLALAVHSVLMQTEPEVEVLIVGDGVTAAVRTAASALAASDPRVKFFDHPKGAHHGETHRHDAILAARSDAIFYLCDDDLLLPEHVADLLTLLETHNFVQCLNGYIDPSGSIGFYAGDLSDPKSIAWHLRDDVRFNSVSVTGTAHSRDFYLHVGDHWETTPTGWWPDHYQWRKLMRHRDFRGATSTRMTALQFPETQGSRAEWTPERRLEELEHWAREISTPRAQDRIDALCRASIPAQLHSDREQAAEALGRERVLVERVTELEQEIAGLRMTRSWRWTRPMRALLSLRARRTR